MNILIVEDESIVALEIQDYLQDFGYKNVYKADTAEKAIDVVKIFNIDLVLMDINLKSEINGIQAIKEIKKLYSDISVIYITSYQDEETIDEAIQTNPTSYLIKPFQSIDLKVQIKIVKNKNIKLKQYDNNLLCFFDGKFAYNIQSKEFFHNGVKIKLTKREIKLLEAVISNINTKYITNEQIESAVWGDKFVQDNTKRVVIHKVNSKFNNRLLTNDYGCGYKITIN